MAGTSTQSSPSAKNPPFEAKDALDILKKKLTQRKPKMLFSVIGDSDSFVPKPWPKAVFQSGLITAAKNAGDSWIIYEGKEKGVSAVVYDALEEYDRIEFYNSKGKRLKRYGDNSVESENTGEKKKKKKTTSAPLIELIGIKPNNNNNDQSTAVQNSDDNDCDNPNFLTDLPIQYSGRNTAQEHKEFLVEFEEMISRERRSFFKGFEMRIPVLIVVVEGDLQTISHVTMAVKRGLPVLIVEGTGKAADLIAECLEGSWEEILKKRAPILFGTSFDTGNFDDLKNMIKYIAKNQWLINVFNIDTDDPIKMSQIAGEAVTRAWAMEQVPNDETIDDVKSESYRSVTFNISSIDGKREEEYDDSVGRNIPNITDVPPAAEYIPKNDDMAKKPTVSKSEEQNTEKSKSVETRSYVLASEFTSPSSLPLYFYFAYQMLQEKKSNNHK